jgi:hypothetical protein
MLNERALLDVNATRLRSTNSCLEKIEAFHVIRDAMTDQRQ